MKAHGIVGLRTTHVKHVSIAILKGAGSIDRGRPLVLLAKLPAGFGARHCIVPLNTCTAVEV